MVEHNPEDGAWLLARYVCPAAEPPAEMAQAVYQAGLASEHTWTCIADGRTKDVLVYLHAGDILELWEL